MEANWDPRHKMHLGLNYSDPKIVNAFVGINAFAKIYYDNENILETDKYVTLDASVSRSFFEKLTVFVNVENILNNEYPIFLSDSSGNTIAPGIIAIGGVKFEF